MVLELTLWSLSVVLLGHSNVSNFLSSIQLNFQLPNVNNTIHFCVVLCVKKKKKELLMVQAGNGIALLQLSALTVIAQGNLKYVFMFYIENIGIIIFEILLENCIDF